MIVFAQTLADLFAGGKAFEKHPIAVIMNDFGFDLLEKAASSAARAEAKANGEIESKVELKHVADVIARSAAEMGLPLTVMVQLCDDYLVIQKYRELTKDLCPEHKAFADRLARSLR